MSVCVCSSAAAAAVTGASESIVVARARNAGSVGAGLFQEVSVGESEFVCTATIVVAIAGSSKGSEANSAVFASGFVAGSTAEDGVGAPGPFVASECATGTDSVLSAVAADGFVFGSCTGAAVRSARSTRVASITGDGLFVRESVCASNSVSSARPTHTGGVG